MADPWKTVWKGRIGERQVEAQVDLQRSQLRVNTTQLNEAVSGMVEGSEGTPISVEAETQEQLLAGLVTDGGFTPEHAAEVVSKFA